MIYYQFFSTVTGPPTPAQNQHMRHGGVDIPCTYEIIINRLATQLDILDIIDYLPVLDETPIKARTFTPYMVILKIYSTILKVRSFLNSVMPCSHHLHAYSTKLIVSLIILD